MFGRSSKAVLDIFFKNMKAFGIGTKESLYANTIGRIVVMLAISTKLEKDKYNERMADAHLMAEDGRINITRKESLAYLIGGGIKLLLIGGAGTIFTIAILSILSSFITIPIFEGGLGRSATWTSIALVLAFTVFGVCVRSHRLGRRIRIIIDGYRKAIEEAKVMFERDIGQLYDSAISAANDAYFRCVGKHPPSSSEKRRKELFVNNVSAVVFSADESILSQIATEASSLKIPEKELVKRSIAGVTRLYKWIKRHTVSASGKCRRAYRTYRM